MSKTLKQKIHENTAIIYNVLRSFEHGKHYTFPSGLVAHKDDKVLLLSDVNALLDEAAKEVNQIMCEDYWTSNFALYKVRLKILAVLGVDGKEKARP